MAWGLFLDNAWRLRVAGMGFVAGIEGGNAMPRLVAAGVDQFIAEDLLVACERGMVTALNEKEDTDGHED